MKYFIIDAGKEFMTIAEILVKEFKSRDYHVAFFYTDHPKLMCVEEVTEDEFLDCFSNEKNTI